MLSLQILLAVGLALASPAPVVLALGQPSLARTEHEQTQRPVDALPLALALACPSAVVLAESRSEGLRGCHWSGRTLWP